MGYKRVINGEYSHVYGSPESFLSKEAWRDVFSTRSFRAHLIGVAIDEVHCISHWCFNAVFNVHVLPKIVSFVLVTECNMPMLMLFYNVEQRKEWCRFW